MIEEALYIDLEATFDSSIQEIGIRFKEDELKTNSIKEAY